MSVYKQLVSLATKPCFDNIMLTNEKGDKLLSHKDVINELESEFSDNSLVSSLSIDMRQACETRVSEN
ncbi:hypothetical protein ACNVED_16795 (plasmid) [Legionella sp. D16C41]|uniref:hypothetical protein n=1 Tax=Legionella sp. D16C41 TaxID=3402688 RepID=UPI003AF4E379